MIRIARTYTAKPGKERELVEVLKEIKGYARTQGVESRIFTEPWGPGGVVHLHNDFEWQTLSTNPRAKEPLMRLQLLVEGHRQTSFLVKTT